MSRNNTKECICCERSLPTTTEFFPERQKTNTGHLALRPACHDCYAKHGGLNSAYIKFLVGRKDKACPHCGTVFTPKSGQHKFCSESCKGRHTSKLKGTDGQYRNITGNWRNYLTRLRQTRKDRKRDVTSAELLELLERQNYRCALTGVELTCNVEKGVKCPTNASLDRIVAGGPYTIDNIQMVCSAVNSFRVNASVDDFVAWCRKVVEYADSKEKGQ